MINSHVEVFDSPAPTDRLLFRRWTLDDADAEAAFAMYGDPEVMRFLGSGPHPLPSVDAVRERIARWAERAATNPGEGLWAVIERRTGLPIGTGLLQPLPREDLPTDAPLEYEVGYHVARAHWGHGYATEIATALIAYAWSGLNLPKVVGVVFTENLASRRVLEKVGLRHQGRVRAYGLTPEYYVLERPRDAD